MNISSKTSLFYHFLPIIITMNFLSSCSHLFYVPTTIEYATPELFKIKNSKVNFKSDDGTPLNGLHLKNKSGGPPKSLILYFHGNSQNLSAHFIRFEFLTRLGHDVFLFDYRGYGKSYPIFPNQQGTHQDGLAALKFARNLKREIKAEKFIVFASSLGGIIGMRSLIDYKLQHEIDLLVLDSTFMSYVDIAKFKAKTIPIFTPLYPFVPILISDEYAAIDKIDQINIPTLVIHGKKDKVVPYSFGAEIFNALKIEKKWMWTIAEGQHVDCFRYKKGNIYRDKFAQFVAELI